MSETGSQDSVSAESASVPSAQKPRLTGFPLLIVALGVVLLVQAAFVLSYVGAFHAPKPHGVPLGVVGTSHFDGNGITRSLLVLAAYLVVGAFVVIVIRQRRPSSGAAVEAEASAAAAAAVV